VVRNFFRLVWDFRRHVLTPSSLNSSTL
jgi:hypothetical protein